MEQKKDPFKTDKPLYDYNISYDYSKLSKDLIEIIHELIMIWSFLFLMLMQNHIGVIKLLVLSHIIIDKIFKI